jgi:hypothetical protein
MILDDKIVNGLFPQDLKTKYKYARETTLKIDFVNDIPSHFGEIQQFALFHRVDSWRNIPVNYEDLLRQIKTLHNDIFNGRENSLNA